MNAADSDDRQPRDPAETGAASPHALSYRPAGVIAAERRGLVTVGTHMGRDTARVIASVIEGEGIECHVFNQNSEALGPFATGFAGCQLQVPALDAPRARELIQQLVEDPDSVEPAEDPPGTPPRRAEDGSELVVAGEYDHPRSLHEAAAVLGSARIAPYLPRLVARGDGPRGAGNRFILRVESGEADRARSLLEDARDEEEADARERNLVRCPKCDRLTGERIPRAWQWFVAFATFRPFPEPEAHCGPCRHKWTIEQ